jgi:hypothetical protein
MLLVAAVAAIFGGGLCALADEPAAKNAGTSAAALTEAQLDELFAKAVILNMGGRYDEAEAAARQILARKPDNRDVQQLLEEITRARAASRGRTDNPTRGLKKKLDGILIPEVNVREANVRDVVQFLQDESGRLSPDKTGVNFVWLVPAEEKVPPVTMQLRKMPLAEVIRYVLAAARLNYRVEPYAVVIYKETPEPAPPGSSAPEPNVKPQ